MPRKSDKLNGFNSPSDITGRELQRRISEMGWAEIDFARFCQRKPDMIRSYFQAPDAFVPMLIKRALQLAETDPVGWLHLPEMQTPKKRPLTDQRRMRGRSVFPSDGPDNWQPIDTVPLTGKIKIAKYEPGSRACKVETINLYPDMIEQVRKKQLRHAEAWMPVAPDPEDAVARG